MSSEIVFSLVIGGKGIHADGGLSWVKHKACVMFLSQITHHMVEGYLESNPFLPHTAFLSRLRYF
jgi:hypothetical protein